MSAFVNHALLTDQPAPSGRESGRAAGPRADDDFTVDWCLPPLWNGAPHRPRDTGRDVDSLLVGGER